MTSIRPAIAALGGVCLAILAPVPGALAPSPLSAQQFGGAAVALSGQAAIGEPGNRTMPGVVYIYDRADGGWTEAGRLAVSPVTDPPDGFGHALAAGADLLAVGAPLLDGGRGAVVLYSGFGRPLPPLVGEAGRRETLRLQAEMPAEDANFGAALALDGNLLAVAAPGENDGAGAVHLFMRDGDGWMSRSIVQPGDDAAPGFGAQLALHESSLLVATTPGRGNPPELHAFRIDPATGAAAPLGRLDAGEFADNAGFGSAMAVRGSMALVGAPRAGGAGAVALYRLDDTDGGWESAGALRPFHADGFDQFGAAIGFEGDVLWVGAPGTNGRGGAIHRFAADPSGSGWSGATRVTHDGLPDAASFGASVAIADEVAVVGAGGIDGRAGGAVLMARAEDGMWTPGELVVGEHRGLPAIVGRDDEIECEDNAAAGYDCDNVNIISFLPINEMAGGRGSRLNDIWGWTDPESGREIAIVGRTDGTAFVDLTDPYNPVMLGDLPKTPGSRSAAWRDMKVYRDHTYIVADGAGAHGVQVFDLRRLRDVAGDPPTFEPDFLYEGINSAHNIVLNEQTGFAFVVGASGGGETCGGGLHMLDLSEPGRPAFAGCFFDGETGRRGTGYSHDAQCVVYHGPDEAYQGREICLGSNETALSISDVSDKDNPVSISIADYPNVAYAHQGWLTEDHRFFYMNDEGDEPQGLVEGTRTLIWDLEDLDEPVLAGEYIAQTPDTDHNLYIRDNLMYQSNYGAGLRILDITNRIEPEEIAYFDNSPYGGASWSNYPYFASGVIVMTSTGDGLFIVRNTARRNLIP